MPCWSSLPQAHVCHKLEEIFPGQKFDAENMTLLYVSCLFVSAVAGT